MAALEELHGLPIMMPLHQEAATWGRDAPEEWTHTIFTPGGAQFSVGLAPSLAKVANDLAASFCWKRGIASAN